MPVEQVKAITAALSNIDQTEALSRRVSELSRQVDFWNRWMLWGLLAGAIAAAWVVITTSLVIVRSKDLATTQGRLDTARDLQAKTDSKNKDLRIAEVTADAGKANERAATLELESLKLRGQLLLQGSRANLLSGERRKKFIAAIKLFAGNKADVRYSANTIMVNSAIVTSTPVGDDVTATSEALLKAMSEAGWVVPSKPLIGSLVGRGIEVDVSPLATADTKRAASALVAALRSLPVETTGPYEPTDTRLVRIGNQASSTAVDENTIVIAVLTHE